MSTNKKNLLFSYKEKRKKKERKRIHLMIASLLLVITHFALVRGSSTSVRSMNPDWSHNSKSSSPADELTSNLAFSETVWNKIRSYEGFSLTKLVTTVLYETYVCWYIHIFSPLSRYYLSSLYYILYFTGGSSCRRSFWRRTFQASIRRYSR